MGAERLLGQGDGEGGVGGEVEGWVAFAPVPRLHACQILYERLGAC